MNSEVRIPAWENGTLVARGKMDVHKRGLRHPAVSVFVMRGDEILMQRRALSKYHTPGLWANTCCTHPNWGEDPRDCVIRRLEEELGISGLDPVYRKTVEYRAEVGNDLIEHEVVDIFLADVDGPLMMHLAPDEVADIRWTTLDALRADIAQRPHDYTPWLRIYLEEHISGLFD